MQVYSLGNTYVKPNGYFPSYVFRYPSKPEHEPYQGEGPKIREEINKGAVLVNYYGHGGGYQWDLVFTNDDIYLLENEGRLPLILSVNLLHCSLRKSGCIRRAIQQS